MRYRMSNTQFTFHECDHLRRNLGRVAEVYRVPSCHTRLDVNKVDHVDIVVAEGVHILFYDVVERVIHLP